jgi:hypothetical protein
VDYIKIITLFQWVAMKITTGARLLPMSKPRGFRREEFVDEAQAVRVHRNNLVHRRIDDYYAVMAFTDARAKLLTYIGKLPETWG